MTDKHYLSNIYCGKISKNYGIETAIDKVIVKTALYLSLTGLTGDQCADKDHHGGFERALHQYPLEHYAYWQEKYNDKIDWLAPGMGENLSSLGMTEDNVCLGDRFQWGDAIIEVSQPRSPCFKLNKRWGIEKLSVDMQDSLRCGWLYRVIQPGIVSIDKPLVFISRPANAMSVREVCQAFFGDPLDKEGLLQLTQQSTLSESWMDKVQQRLETGKVENWSFRLLEHA